MPFDSSCSLAASKSERDVTNPMCGIALSVAGVCIGSPRDGKRATPLFPANSTAGYEAHRSANARSRPRTPSYHRIERSNVRDGQSDVIERLEIHVLSLPGWPEYRKIGSATMPPEQSGYDRAPDRVWRLRHRGR
jgi:hypothetical protein